MKPPYEWLKSNRTDEYGLSERVPVVCCRSLVKQAVMNCAVGMASRSLLLVHVECNSKKEMNC